MLRVLGRANSINVRKVLWTCGEIGLAYDREDWGGAFASTADPAFLALNPNGLVPVIQDETGVLWESNTICRYLAGRHGRHDLLPTEPRARAEVEQWMDWQSTDLNGAWNYAFLALVRRTAGYDDPARVEASAAEWNRKMGILDRRLAETGAFVAGPGFTLADILLGLSVKRWLATPIEHAECPAARAYFERLSARPAFQAHGGPGEP